MKIFCGFFVSAIGFWIFFLDRQSAQNIFFCCFCLDLFQNFFYLSGSAQILILFVWIGSQSPSGSFIQTPVNQFASAANSNNNYKLLLLLLFLRFDVYFRKQAGFYTVCETVVTRCRKGIFGEKVVAGTRP